MALAKVQSVNSRILSVYRERYIFPAKNATDDTLFVFPAEMEYCTTGNEIDALVVIPPQMIVLVVDGGNVIDYAVGAQEENTYFVWDKSDAVTNSELKKKKVLWPNNISHSNYRVFFAWDKQHRLSAEISTSIDYDRTSLSFSATMSFSVSSAVAAFEKAFAASASVLETGVQTKSAITDASVKCLDIIEQVIGSFMSNDLTSTDILEKSFSFSEEVIQKCSHINDAQGLRLMTMRDICLSNEADGFIIKRRDAKRQQAAEAQAKILRENQIREQLQQKNKISPKDRLAAAQGNAQPKSVCDIELGASLTSKYSSEGQNIGVSEADVASGVSTAVCDKSFDTKQSSAKRAENTELYTINDTVLSATSKEMKAKPETKSVWVCTQCESENLHEMRFCPKCGKEKQTKPDWKCSRCGEQNTKNFCPNCGQAKPANQYPTFAFCPTCGKSNH